MELFWKVTAGVLLSVILILAIGKQERDFSALLILAVCCIAGMAALHLMEPVLEFLYELQSMCEMENSLFKSLLKLLGISLVCEITSMICVDAGCSALGKSIQFLGTAVIMYLSVPVLQMFVSLIRDILGGL